MVGEARGGTPGVSSGTAMATSVPTQPMASVLHCHGAHIGTQQSTTFQGSDTLHSMKHADTVKTF